MRQSTKPAFTSADRFLLAGLLHHLPMDKLRQLQLLVRLDTILRRHRSVLKRGHAAARVPRRAGRPRTVRSVRVLVLRLARENSSWGYRRIPDPINDPDQITRLDVLRHDRLGGTLHEYKHAA